MGFNPWSPFRPRTGPEKKPGESSIEIPLRDPSLPHGVERGSDGKITINSTEFDPRTFDLSKLNPSD
jgi:hypothetical protein